MRGKERGLVTRGEAEEARGPRRLKGRGGKNSNRKLGMPERKYRKEKKNVL